MTEKISIRFFYASEIPQLGSITTQLELITLDEKSKINDREMFMKGIDYSYYYEEAEQMKEMRKAGDNYGKRNHNSQ